MSRSRTSGLLVVDKPAGPTSHDVVERVRRVLRERVGHAGTLDPQATGVLLLCVGSATRLARFLQGHDKEYEGVVKLGWATDTYDAEGEPLADPAPVPDLEAEQVEAVLRSFIGTQQQVPPVYSAKKVRGQPSYRRVRRGEKVEPKPVTIHIHEAELVELAGDELHIRVLCGAGTYVRTLAHDLGAALGCPAHLAGLRRTRSGPFDLGDAVGWPEIEESSGAELSRRVLPVADMLPQWPAAVVSGEGAQAAANGGVVEAGWIVERRPGIALAEAADASGDGWVRVVDGAGRMIAAGEMVPGGLIQPRIVLR
jgi:tRNA pseudouridine55 synthase